MRGAKKEVLRLLTTFVERAGPPEAPPLQVAQGFLPPMLDPILGDYHVSILPCKTCLLAKSCKLPERVWVRQVMPRDLSLLLNNSLRRSSRDG